MTVYNFSRDKFSIAGQGTAYVDDIDPARFHTFGSPGSRYEWKMNAANKLTLLVNNVGGGNGRREATIEVYGTFEDATDPADISSRNWALLESRDMAGSTGTVFTITAPFTWVRLIATRKTSNNSSGLVWARMQ